MPLLPTQVFVQSRFKTALMLVIGLVFVAIAVFLPQDGQSQNWRYYCGGFFGLGVIILSWLIARPQRLTLDPEGFALSGGLTLPSRVKKILWRDVESFFVFRTGAFNKMIAINFQPDASERTRVARFNRKAFGVDASLPGLWPGGTEKMIQTLSDYRARALAVGDTD